MLWSCLTTTRFFWLCVQAMLRLARLPSSTQNGDGETSLFQVTVSLNIRKDSIAETLPPSRGNAEGAQTSSSNCLVNIQVLLYSPLTHWGISECNPALHYKLKYIWWSAYSILVLVRWNVGTLFYFIFPPDSEKSSGNETMFSGGVTPTDSIVTAATIGQKFDQLFLAYDVRRESS